ncbi:MULTISPECIES: hypothetical protein [Metallosphaera]|uniref:hypothetical protein n=1 Tax=Metallosphaera TaxID=41980 RepID=UPI001F068BF0|nr:hypothetical protein [Metallosphaera sedula]MCH1770347.1 hypothetical protein [Metallosphaera sedula]MCP6727819.1 hypothetical protein [Metallosphaera sedula]
MNLDDRECNSAGILVSFSDGKHDYEYFYNVLEQFKRKYCNKCVSLLSPHETIDMISRLSGNKGRPNRPTGLPMAIPLIKEILSDNIHPKLIPVIHIDREHLRDYNGREYERICKSAGSIGLNCEFKEYLVQDKILVFNFKLNDRDKKVYFVLVGNYLCLEDEILASLGQDLEEPSRKETCDKYYNIYKQKRREIEERRAEINEKLFEKLFAPIFDDLD